MIYKFLIIAVLLLGLFLRLHNYTQYPPRGATSDEYTYTFMGMSLLQKGVPTSWSFFGDYLTLGERYDLTINKIYFPMVTPYFDHPPFNGLIVGGWAILNGQNTFEKVQISTIRQIPILLGMISSLLIFLIAHKLYDKKTAIWTLLIYSTATIIVMETRVVLAENLLTPLYLSSVLLYIHVRKRMRIQHILIFSLISIISFWTKELGITVFLCLLVLMIFEKVSKKLMVIFSLITIFGVSLYALYGYIFNWQLFLAIISAQSLRELGPRTFNMLLFTPVVINKIYFDGWYLLGFMSFFTSFLDFKKHLFILVPSFVYFFLLLFSLTQHGEMGWYMIPLFPFFSILTANLLVTSIKNGGGYIFIASLIVGLFIIRYYYEAKFGLPNLDFRILLLLLFGPLFTAFILKKQTVFRLFSNLLFYFLILMTIYITYYYIHPA